MTIRDRRERTLVAAADAVLWPLGLMRGGRGRTVTAPRRIVCFRLERIGDLLMTAPALADVRALAPEASIDLVVGSWNGEVAAAIPGTNRVETLDARWLARGGESEGAGPIGLALQARRWRTRQYDLAINFEPDIRSNLVMAAAGARRTAGFASGGGGPLLDLAFDYDPSAHTVDNARRLVQAIFGRAPSPDPAWTLDLPQASRDEAARRLAPLAGHLKIGMHVSGGRAIKQWPASRFREVAEQLVRERSAAIVLTGTAADRAQVEEVRRALPADRVLDLSGDVGLLTTAAVMAGLDLFVTGDTGPMHLAHAVGTPIVAVFGPSEPRRYAPRGPRDTIVRIDLPCSPCNRIRQPPARCVGHTPDCLAGIEVARVMDAIDAAVRVGAAP